MKKIASLFVFLHTFVVYSQSSKIKVESIDNKEPIQFASVFLKNAKIGYYTNEIGEAFLDLTTNDSLVISCTGFENKTIATSNLKKQNTIYLKPKILQLDEVTIKRKRTNKYKISKVGNYWEKQKHFIKPVIGTQWAILLKNTEQKEGILEKLNFKFLKREQTKISKVMIKLYSFNQNCRCPSNEILQEALIKDILPNQSYLTIDILEKNIKFPINGIFVSIEILGFVNDGKYEPIKFGYKVEPVLALSNESIEHENWIKSPFVKGWQKFFVKNKLMFGATILY